MSGDFSEEEGECDEAEEEQFERSKNEARSSAVEENFISPPLSLDLFKKNSKLFPSPQKAQAARPE